MRLRILPEAVEDIDAAYAWYLAAPPAIRVRLRDEIDAAFARILENPAQFQRVDGEFRRVLLASFPLGVFYRALPDEAIVVMVFPLRDDPSILKRRLASAEAKVKESEGEGGGV